MTDATNLREAVAAFLKDRDENVLPEEATDIERLGSAEVILGLIAALPAPVGVEGVEADTVWLLEMNHNDAPVPRYWHCRTGFVWGADVATRFSRKEDAQAFLARRAVPQDQRQARRAQVLRPPPRPARP